MEHLLHKKEKLQSNIGIWSEATVRDMHHRRSMQVKQLVHIKARSPAILEACNWSRGEQHAIRELTKLKWRNGIINMQIQDSTGAKKPKQTRPFSFLCPHRLAQEKEHELQTPLSICGVQSRKVLLNGQAQGEPVVSDDTKSSSGAVQGRSRLKSAFSLLYSSFKPAPPPIQ